MASIWDTLPTPIFSLAPMEDVTDTVMRRMISVCGRPAVYFTEFTNVDGIASQGRDVVARRLQFTPEEKPLVAQIWGLKPENFYKAAQELVTRGFDGIDINMGCPQRDVTRHGACSALIKNPRLAQELIQATREGAHSASSGQAGELPVSVKTRIGFSKIQTEEWLGFLLEQDLPLITVHGRTAAEMSKVPAHWDEIGKVVKMRDEREKGAKGRNKAIHTLIFGNGDVQSLMEAKEKVKQYGVDGVMVGRGIFHNPWLFSGIDPATKSVEERLRLLIQHVTLYEATWGEKKQYQVLKKFFKVYLSDFEGAADMREAFMQSSTYAEGIALAESLLKKIAYPSK